ncbi:MAG: DUF3180 family protein [Bifidobacteriaceae bacterium]|jgi:MFS family permease|nr:DUF3180 family protein [Bifidobacteriaceae bacterium]
MQKVSILSAILISVIFICLGYLLNLISLRQSYILIYGSFGLDFGIILSIILILYFALEVKKFLDGKKPDLKPNRAVFALLLSQSGFYSGAAILGILLGGWLSIIINTKGVLLELHSTDSIISFGFAASLIIIGLIGQHLCKTKPPKNKTSN